MFTQSELRLIKQVLTELHDSKSAQYLNQLTQTSTHSETQSLRELLDNYLLLGKKVEDYLDVAH